MRAEGRAERAVIRFQEQRDDQMKFLQQIARGVKAPAAVDEKWQLLSRGHGGRYLLFFVAIVFSTSHVMYREAMSGAAVLVH